MIKWATLLVIIYVLIGCKPNKSSQKKLFYKATQNKTTALLSLTIYKDHFYGQYEIRYSGNGKDSGEVRGVILGDTLKGKYDYISYGGNKKWEPFVLLKHKENFKLGTGAATSYMNIPYYVPESLEFKDSSFLFSPINLELATELNLITE